MELTVQMERQSITVHETVYDQEVEQPLECDALLPDYCPDIVKMLTCRVDTGILSTALNGERLTIEGVALVHVYYASSAAGICHTEYKIPFTRSVELRESPLAPMITVTPQVNYLNCRAVNQRRIDIRGAITLAVRIQSARQESVVGDAQGGGLHLRKSPVRVMGILCRTEAGFALREELECGYGKPPVGTVIRSGARIHLQDYKVIAGKIIAKGELLLHIAYRPVDSDALEIMRYSLPISQILDCEGADEDSRCAIRMMVASWEVTPQMDSMGEYRGFVLEAQCKALITAHSQNEMLLAEDCFSTLCEAKTQLRRLPFAHLNHMLAETILHKFSMDLPESIDTVLDMWCEATDTHWKQEDGGLRLSAHMTVSLFARTAEGEILYFENTTVVEYRLATSADAAHIRFDPVCDVLSLDYTLTGSAQLDVRAEVALQGCLYETLWQEVLGDIRLEETAPKAPPRSGLVLYFAAAGESVWDIAKLYNTAPARIREENALESDMLGEKTMLLIPTAP